MADLVAATVVALREAGVPRVFGVELPPDEHEHMPRRCVVVRGSGGGLLPTAHWMPTGDQRVDVRGYGATPYEAAETEQQVATVLHGWRTGSVDVAGQPVRVLWFRHSGGPNQLRDADTDWPYVLSSWQVYGQRY